MVTVCLNGEHHAEKVAEKIKEIINRYEFDKSKIAAVCDEGSNFVRLFKLGDPLLTFDYDETAISVKNDENDDIKLNIGLPDIDKMFETDEIVEIKNAVKLTETTRHQIRVPKMEQNVNFDFDQYDFGDIGTPRTFVSIEVGSNKIPNEVFEETGRQCPYDLKTLEKYYQILEPLYDLNLFLQRNDSSIAEVIPL